MVACKYSLLALGFSTLAAAQVYGGGGGGSSSSAAPAATATVTNGAIDVQAGTGNGYQFSPNTVQAKVGDIIHFHFFSPNHSVAESSFASPCTYKTGGIWSGFFPTTNNVASTMFSITLNDTNPHWLFCAQNIYRDCQMGMVMVINPPANSPDTLAAYSSAAQGTKTSIAGTTVEGGVVAANVASTTGSAPAASSSTGAAVDVSPRGWLAMVASWGVTVLSAALMA